MFLARKALARLPLIAILSLAACGPVSKLPQVDAKAAAIEAEKQRELILEAKFAQHGRVQTIAHALLERNADLCQADTVHSIGTILANKLSFGDDYEETLARVYRFGEGANVFALADRSPAAEAGLEVGDALVSVNGWPVPTGKEAPKRVTAKIAELANDDPNLRFVVDTPAGRRQATVRAERVCAYKVRVLQRDDVNALADGNNIAVTSGMIRFADSDVELATVVGHEMAHNLMDHIDKQMGNAMIGLLLDILLAGVGVNTQGVFSDLATLVYSKEFEAEADYVGLYLMARAGYPVEDAPRFWRRMAIVHPGSVKSGLAASHPPTPERFVAMEKTVAEIGAKQVAAVPLMPNSEIPESLAERPKAPSPFGAQ
ncbi:MAG: M48 family metallopeptidase [Alphaproteobacteria bacterium]